MYFRPCPYCGANLDPGESCDCRKQEEAKRIEYEKSIKTEESGQIAFAFEVA